MGGNKDVPVITCKNPEHNFYKGQTYRSLEAIPLASKGWANRKSAGDYFVLNAHSGNPARLPANETEATTFAEFGLRPELIRRLEDIGLTAPTAIQRLAIPPIMGGSNAMCAAETGSGKTLAYLLPILSRIFDFKEVVNRDDSYCSPLALILVPGRELAAQIQSVIAKLTHSLPIKSSVLQGGLGTKKIMLDPPMDNSDIVVSSMGIIRKMVSSGIYRVHDVRHLVIDEADTMLDDSFNEETITFLKKMKFRDLSHTSPTDPNAKAQLVMVGATMPRSLAAILKKVVEYNSIAQVATPHLHRIMPHVPQKFLRLRKSDKPDHLLKIVKPEANKKRGIMIFSKDAATCDFVKMFLEENGVPAVNLNGLMKAAHRDGRFEEFQNGDFHVLSCTDIGSRGLDTIRVQHVINYDFPKYMSDYIHRAGRVGRVGSTSTGLVTSFVSSFPEVELVQRIELASRKTQSLPNVNANIKRAILASMDMAEDHEDYL